MKKIIFSWIGLTCLIVSLIVFHICFNLASVIPTNIDWLMSVRHDWGQHYLGWAFYRIEPWTFPLGTIQNFYYPVGSNVGFTDSIPLLAIFFKPFSTILPGDFQYLGLWLFACILLVCLYAALLARTFKVNDKFIPFIIIFVAANPVLIYRGLHPALCAHWIFLAGLYCYFNSRTKQEAQAALVHQFVIVSLSAAINPYLCVMAFGFTFIVSLKQWLEKNLKFKSFILYNIYSVAAVLVIWVLIGLIAIGKDEDLAVSNAYGLYSLNLNVLVNPYGFSKLWTVVLPSVSWHQYEGYMYLGLGMMACVVLVSVDAFFRMGTKLNVFKSWISLNKATLFPIVFFLIALTLFSITNVVSLNDKVIFEYPIPSFVKSLGNTFRASARFFWIPFYMIFIGCLIRISLSQFKSWIKFCVIGIALIIQLYDTWPLLSHRSFKAGTYEMPIDESSWKALIKEFDTLIFYPPFEGTYFTPMDYQDFCYLAAKAKKPITTGYVARIDNLAVNAFKDSLNVDIESGEINERSLIVTTYPNLPQFSELIRANQLKLNVLGNYYFLYSNKRQDKELQQLSERLNSSQKEKLDSALNNFGKPTELKVVKGEMANSKDLKFFIEKYRDTNKILRVSGWAFNPLTPKKSYDSIFLYFTSPEIAYRVSISEMERPDVADYYHVPGLRPGFALILDKNKLAPGKYQMDIGIRDSLGRLAIMSADRMLTIGQKQSVEKIINPKMSEEIDQNFDQFEDKKTFVEFGGWAHFRNHGSEGNRISAVLKNGDDYFLIPTEGVLRPDVTAHFNNTSNFDYSGFHVQIRKSLVPPGEYQVGIHIKNSKRNTEGMLMLNRTVIF